MGELKNIITNSIGMPLVLIPAGEFLMGSPIDEARRSGDEGPQHQVRVTRPFHLSAHEVTQEQYERVMGMNPSNFKGPQHPVETVSWDDAVGFCNKLSALPEEKSAGRMYRLPTEAEWEYACRAGSTTPYSFGDEEDALGDHGWFSDNSSAATHPVGEKQPNAWGLYDMHGNVWEWCQDWFGGYTDSPVDDPPGFATGSARGIRGGCWLSSTKDCRTADRLSHRPDSRYFFLGFRVATVSSASQASSASPASGARRMAGPDPEQPTASPPPAPEHPTVLQADLTNSIGMQLRLIPAGEFLMGSSESPEELARAYRTSSDEVDFHQNEHPRHHVRITRPFYLSVCEVTQEQYTAVTETRPWGGQQYAREGSNFPATYVSWDDATEFCIRLSQTENRTYRLPTEAEWEYACRAGSSARYHFGNAFSKLDDYAWFIQNTSLIGEVYAHEVGRKKPNAFGLYDMHGNVWELCTDWYHESYYQISPVDDPTGPATGSRRVIRGGSWLDSTAAKCRVTFRFTFQPDGRVSNLGFRVAAVPSSK